MTSIALAMALLTPAISYAEGSCASDSLTSATVAPRLTYTENLGAVSDGGVLSNLTKIDRQRTLFDTSTCQTFTELLVADKTGPYAIGKRTVVSDGRISEIETVWASSGYRGFDIDRYLKNSSSEDWSDIPPAKRDNRAILQSAANAYLDALLQGKATLEPWGLPCNRTTADGSCRVAAPAGVVNVANRHYVIDTTKGTVAVFSIYGYDPATTRIRASDVHVFRVENGKVRFVHAITHVLQADNR